MAAATQPPWQSTATWISAGNWPHAGQWRHRSPSPRAKGDKGKSKDKQKKGKGKAQGTLPSPRGGSGKGAEAPAVPDTSLLPTPPPAPSLTTPSLPTAQNTDPTMSEAQQRLDMIMGTLRSTRESLPAEVAKLLGEHEVQNTQAHAKALHQAVRSQTVAKKELQRTRAARQNYVQSWLSYVELLSKQLQEQFKAQEDTLRSFADAETKWMSQLAEASANLSRLSGDTHVVNSDSEEMDTSDKKPAEVEVDPWGTEEFVRELRERQRKLSATLELGKDSAMAATESVKREGSRTPRRVGKDSKEEDGAAPPPQNAQA